jgi:DNA polymerase
MAEAPTPLDALTLDAVAQTASNCSLCARSASRTGVVVGTGNPEADLMFVVEAPGYHDDRLGHPLAGPAGDAFDGLLAGIDLTRDDVYLTCLVKCRPPNNRTPYREEVEQCEGYLFRQVSLVRPKVICAIGNLVTRLLTGKSHVLRETHGQPLPCTIRGDVVQVVPMFHPAVASYTPEIGSVLRRDFAQLPALVRGEQVATDGDAVPEVAPPTPTPPVQDEDAPQLSFDV